MRKRFGIVLSLAVLLIGAAGAPWACAQATTNPNNGSADSAQLKPADSYKVEFAVNEIEDGKKINSRSYTMLMRAEPAPKWSDRQVLRVGSKVPVTTTGGDHVEIQYQDVGMNIDCRLMPMGNGEVSVDANLQYSSVASEQERGHPVFRQVRAGGAAVVPLDKSTVFAEMDDVASTRRYVFEVKVTKVS